MSSEEQAALYEWICLGDSLATLHECDDGNGMTPGQVARELCAPTDWIRDALRDLTAMGYVERIARARFRLTLLGQMRAGE